MSKRPVIGVTLDSEQPGGYSKYPWYALRRNYLDAVAAAGGLPVAVPHDAALAGDYLDQLDALMVTGGAFDVDPSLYGDAARHATVTLKENRTAGRTGADLGRARPRHAGTGHLRRPAIAGGRSGRHADPAHSRRDRGRAGARAAEPSARAGPYRYGRARNVAAPHRWRGARCRSTPRITRRCATLARNAIVNATAPDGVIEGVEDARHRFCLGVQWHPEYFIDPGDRRIFDALIAACRS